MIFIGLAGWGDHDDLYTVASRQSKLEIYAGHFPIVEIDASFYAVQPLRNMEKWARETPPTFRFIVKAFQGMTGHQKGFTPFETKQEMFEAFRQSLDPLLKTNKLAMVLCQFPPWFDCKKEHVQWIRYVKAELKELPAALEFRHRSWFEGEMRDRTLQFMKDEGWIHSICDEPQAGMRSIPTVLQATNRERTLIRFHGRNVHGWNDPGDGTWRDVRYLYQYNKEELQEWQQRLTILSSQTKDIYCIFNNNSGGDAARNAKQLVELCQIDYQGLAPRQLDLFS